MIQDYQGAVKWLRLAAESGHSRAQFDLASMYRYGKGTATDKIRAYTWFNVAAAQGLQEAAVARDTLLHELSPSEIVQAQEEARRLSESQSDAPSTIK